MPNYYEILQISPDATVPEIKAACEIQHNRWQRLMTSHDPGLADRAAQALRFVGTACTTLLDPTKRATYDASLNSQGPIGGLADPQAKLKANVPLPPKPPASSLPTPAEVPLDTWICPKCHAPNVRKMPYCPQCGEQVAHECPKCGEMIEKAAQFCSHCGVDVQIYRVTQRFEVLREKLQVERRHLDYLQRRCNKVILLPKTEEEGRWDSEFVGYGTKFDMGQAMVLAVFFAVMIVGGVIGFQIGAMIDPRGFGWGEPATGAEIGAVLGALVGSIIGGIVAVYVGYNISYKPKVKTRIEVCKANITQLEHQIQNLGIGLPLMDR
jgi:hypothetical protein